MDDFLIYLRLGFDHITDPSGYDHILFVIALCAVYTVQQWKQVLILVTAFTIGHSITLALATLQLIHYKTDLIELLIPITILITAITNFLFSGTQIQVAFIHSSATKSLLALWAGFELRPYSWAWAFPITSAAS